ncbi:MULTISPECIES: chorismate mutase family protein [Sinorhizobium]|uniref:chorismate mutase n=1 Tax=Rhizobium fredii TaxID=380 RepID=A0A2L0H1Q7_RHIFR|nr:MULTISPECIES: chorismate mutase family protein [Sinorhizobium]AUX75132.1 chorismate mutase type II protein [Sinorhizobium fredii]PDT53966.1 chorismate mutase [Sinorhizobium sp. NG07B]POH31025.1 chorismate mutase [Sinorhizobium americanum]
MPKTPAECTTMADVRAQIDRLDRALMALFAERWGYIDRAAEIKRPLYLKADIPARVAEVRENARRHAIEFGLDPDFYERLWTQLIDHAIAHERKLLGEDEE